MERQTLPERITQAVMDWPQWSRAERERMPDIVDEVLAHCRDGQGNSFIREWCNRFLTQEVQS